MNIGLIDVDGHNFPNLALMRISAYHKQRGDHVEWWWTDFVHYDIVYMSKIFSDIYSPDIPEPLNADKVIKGGGRDTASIWSMAKRCSTRSIMRVCRQRLNGCFPTIPSILSLTLRSA